MDILDFTISPINQHNFLWPKIEIISFKSDNIYIQPYM